MRVWFQAHAELQESLFQSQQQALGGLHESTNKMIHQQAEAAWHTAETARHIKEVSKINLNNPLLCLRIIQFDFFYVVSPCSSLSLNSVWNIKSVIVSFLDDWTGSFTDHRSIECSWSLSYTSVWPAETAQPQLETASDTPPHRQVAQ